jgi:hypothetical protein
MRPLFFFVIAPAGFRRCQRASPRRRARQRPLSPARPLNGNCAYPSYSAGQNRLTHCTLVIVYYSPPSVFDFVPAEGHGWMGEVRSKGIWGLQANGNRPKQKAFRVR